ncbi:MAG: MATE family efflux transporter, partial [Caulobacterales bacterium]
MADGGITAKPTTERATLRILLTLALPVIVSRLCIMIMGVVDTMVVGHFNTDELASLSLGWAATSPVLVCGIGLLQGVQILAARYYGSGDLQSAAGVFRQGIRYGILVGILFGGIIIAGIGPALNVLNQPPELRDTAASVAVMLSLSLPLFMVSTVATFFLEGLGRALPGMVVMIIANVVNLLLNLWLVGGGFGIEPLGAVGSAMATFGARIALVAGVLAYIFWGPSARSFGVRIKAKPSGHLAPEMRRIGYAAGVSQFAEAGAFASMNFIAGWSGALAVASFAIVLNLSSLAFMIPMGLAAATSVLTSHAVGAASPKNAMHATWLGLRVTFCACLAIECLVA